MPPAGAQEASVKRFPVLKPEPQFLFFLGFSRGSSHSTFYEKTPNCQAQYDLVEAFERKEAAIPLFCIAF
jgi:hypothetical protein